MKPRLLPEVTPRVESGAIQFGDDWRGRRMIRAPGKAYTLEKRISLVNPKQVEELAPDIFALGRKLGYPECCIAYFAVRSIAFYFGQLIPIPEGTKLRGTGFVPCAMCNETKSEAQLLAEIAHNRQVNTPFPNYRPEDEECDSTS
jgi:hypothetical protein